MIPPPLHRMLPPLYRVEWLTGEPAEIEARLNALAAHGYRVRWLIKGGAAALLERTRLPSGLPAAPGTAPSDP